MEILDVLTGMAKTGRLGPVFIGADVIGLPGDGHDCP